MVCLTPDINAAVTAESNCEVTACLDVDYIRKGCHTVNTLNLNRRLSYRSHIVGVAVKSPSPGVVLCRSVVTHKAGYLG